MRESIGSTFLYNIIFLFIIIVFGLITATLNYYKAFKVNTRILQAIQKNSGYNRASKADIDRVLSGIGYTSGGSQQSCPSRDGVSPVSSNKAGAGDSIYLYCVYYYPDENGEKESGMRTQDNRPLYYSYGVTTYIFVDLPIVGQFKIPVFSKGERIRRFSNKNNKTINCQKGVDC